jgi:hypothetical protein
VLNILAERRRDRFAQLAAPIWRRELAIDRRDDLGARHT